MRGTDPVLRHLVKGAASVSDGYSVRGERRHVWLIAVQERQA